MKKVKPPVTNMASLCFALGGLFGQDAGLGGRGLWDTADELWPTSPRKIREEAQSCCPIFRQPELERKKDSQVWYVASRHFLPVLSWRDRPLCYATPTPTPGHSQSTQKPRGWETLPASNHNSTEGAT